MIRDPLQGKVVEFKGETFSILRKIPGRVDNQGFCEAMNTRAKFPKPIVIIPIELPPEEEGDD